MTAEYTAPVWYWALLYAALGALLILFVVFLVLFVRARSKARKDAKGGRDAAALDGAADLLAEDYAFRRSFASALEALGASERPRYDSAASRHREATDAICAEMGLEVVSYDGLTYDESWPVDPLNADEFTPGETLVVMRTAEPAVIDRTGGKVLRYGKVTLGRKAR